MQCKLFSALNVCRLSLLYFLASAHTTKAHKKLTECVFFTLMTMWQSGKWEVPEVACVHPFSAPPSYLCVFKTYGNLVLSSLPCLNLL